MRFVFAAAILALLVFLPVTALAIIISDPPGVAVNNGLVQDYHRVRAVGLALAALAFLVGVAKAATCEVPHEKSRAQDLVVKAAVIFVILAGDRLIARGVSGWLGLPRSSLPIIWQ